MRRATQAQRANQIPKLPAGAGFSVPLACSYSRGKLVPAAEGYVLRGAALPFREVTQVSNIPGCRRLS